MKRLERVYCRAFQGVFRAALPFMPYREPKILHSIVQIPDVLQERNISKVLLVTDESIRGLGLTKHLEEELRRRSIFCAVYDKVVANPTIQNIEQARAVYLKSGAQAMIAFGGGSVMDCAKVTGARIVKPRKPVYKMKGLLRICKPLPLLIAVPTTAGTGSETTLAAVITDSGTKHKYPINDFSLIPQYAVLDYHVTLGLPKGITATTGMDALTHAIEGYITKGAWELSDMFHIKAIEIISRSLRAAVNNEKEGREGMALGQYVAGMGFSNVGLGVDHSMAHTLSAYYDTPHGKACAILLPTVMAYNAPASGEKYREIARAMGVKGVDDMTQEEYRKAAVDAVRRLAEDVGIPVTLKGIVKEEDIPALSASAYADACRPGNPRETSEAEIAELFRSLL